MNYSKERKKIVVRLLEFRSSEYSYSVLRCSYYILAKRVCKMI